MLLTVVYSFIVYLCKFLFHYKISSRLIPTAILLGILFVVTKIIFSVMNHIMYKKSDSGRYKEIWDEPGIIIVSITYSTLNALAILLIGANMQNALLYQWWIIPTMVGLVIHDVINVAVIYNTYSFDIKESIKDAVLLQIRCVSNSLIVAFMVVLAMNWTIMGVFLAFLLIATIFGIFIK